MIVRIIDCTVSTLQSKMIGNGLSFLHDCTISGSIKNSLLAIRQVSKIKGKRGEEVFRESVTCAIPFV